MSVIMRQGNELRVEIRQTGPWYAIEPGEEKHYTFRIQEVTIADDGTITQHITMAPKIEECQMGDGLPGIFSPDLHKVVCPRHFDILYTDKKLGL